MRLSVVVPAHDAGRWLAASLESLFAEIARSGLGANEFEVVVVDDASRDDTASVLAPWTDRLRVLRHGVAAGPSGARNAGVAASHGDILAFHDADDLVLPGRITTLLACLDADPGCALAFGNGRRVDVEGRDLHDPVVPPRMARRLRAGVRTADLLQGSWIYLQGLMIRRSAFTALGGLRFPCAEDLDLGLRASRRVRIAFVDEPVFAYRRHAGALTASEAAVLDASLRVVETFLAEDPEAAREIGPRAIARAQARRLARGARYRRRAGDLRGADELLRRAVALEPWRLRWRWRRLRERIAGTHPSP